MSLLEVDRLSKHFGGVRAVEDVSMSLAEGEILGLIGPNGAGKTTVFSLISGSLRPTAGAIRLDGRDLAGRSAFAVCRAGIARTFQVVRPFRSLTVWENVLVGAENSGTRGAEAHRRATEALDTVGLEVSRDRSAGELSLINMKRLEIARALASRPRLLLLDEVFAGLTPGELPGAVELVRRIRDRGVALIVIEHLMAVVMELSDRVVVLDHGSKLAEGTPDDVVHRPEVIEAYLGTEYADAGD